MIEENQKVPRETRFVSPHLMFLSFSLLRFSPCLSRSSIFLLFCRCAPLGSCLAPAALVNRKPPERSHPSFPASHSPMIGRKSAPCSVFTPGQDPFPACVLRVLLLFAFAGPRIREKTGMRDSIRVCLCVEACLTIGGVCVVCPGEASRSIFKSSPAES